MLCPHLRLRPAFAVFLLLAASLCLPAPPLLAQDPAGEGGEAASAPVPSRPDDEPRGSFGEAIEVRLIDVEVVVTDRQGRRVTGLTRDDFTLYVGDQEVGVAFFDEVRDGGFVAEGAPVVAEGASDEAVPAPEQPVETSYLLFLDDYFTRPPYRNRVLEGLEKDLSALGPDDRFAAVSFDGQRLEVLSDWIQDPDGVAEVVAAARKRDGWKAFLEQQRFRIGSARPEPGSAQAQGMARLMADQLSRTYSALATALRTFADVPGRRVALIVAGGWPYELSADGFEVNRGRSLLFDVERPLRRVADVANATGFTLYPIDAPGGEGSGGGADSRDFASDLGYGYASQGEREERSLLMLAERTGGEALLDGQRLRPLGPVLADTRSYYWLSFNHRRRGDGALRDIRVEVGRPGLAVRSRTGFLDLSRGAEAEIKAEQALLLGDETEDTLEVEVGRVERSGRRMDVPFSVFLPIPELAVTPLPAGRGSIALELRVAVEDARGDRSDVSRQELDLELSAMMMDMQRVPFDAAVRLRRKPHTLVFVLSEPATGQSWVARREIEPPG